jgi:hypothetical protein
VVTQRLGDGDEVAGLGLEEETVDGVEDGRHGGVRGPVAGEEGVADAAVAVDLGWCVSCRYESTYSRVLTLGWWSCVMKRTSGGKVG